jgi:hypothetical protein
LKQKLKSVESEKQILITEQIQKEYEMVETEDLQE